MSQIKDLVERTIDARLTAFAQGLDQKIVQTVRSIIAADLGLTAAPAAPKPPKTLPDGSPAPKKARRGGRQKGTLSMSPLAIAARERTAEKKAQKAALRAQLTGNFTEALAPSPIISTNLPEDPLMSTPVVTQSEPVIEIDPNAF